MLFWIRAEFGVTKKLPELTEDRLNATVSMRTNDGFIAKYFCCLKLTTDGSLDGS